MGPRIRDENVIGPMREFFGFGKGKKTIEFERDKDGNLKAKV